VKHETRRSPAKTRSTFLRNYISSWDGTDNFPAVTWSTMPACAGQSPTSMAPFLPVLRASPRCYSVTRAGRATRCLYPDRRLGLVRAAPRAESGNPARNHRAHSGHRNGQADSGKSASRWWAPAALLTPLGMRFREVKLRWNPECPICGDHPHHHEAIGYHQFCGVPEPRQARARSGGPRETQAKSKLPK